MSYRTEEDYSEELSELKSDPVFLEEQIEILEGELKTEGEKYESLAEEYDRAIKRNLTLEVRVLQAIKHLEYADNPIESAIDILKGKKITWTE